MHKLHYKKKLRNTIFCIKSKSLKLGQSLAKRIIFNIILTANYKN